MPREEEDSLGQDVTKRPDPGDDRAKGKGSLGQEPTVGRSAPIFDESWSPPEVVAGRYRIEEQVGQGGMGIVYRGHDTQLNRDVAVKFITEGSVGRLRSEALAIARLDHPNIVHVYEIDRQENLHYIVMGFIRGESLAQRLRREETIPLNEAIEITVCLCEALAHAHGQDVIHRDIKPSNALLSRDGTPILVDFGIARVNTDDGESTRMGTVLGTVDYMAPEQRQDATLVDARSDLWSLAATLYQMVTGEPPPVINLDTVPQQLRQILAKALKSKKEDRYQTATEFADALQKAAGGPLLRDPSMSVASLQKGQCFQCGTINANSRKFCEECAAALQVRCMSCEETIRVWEKVCGECGAKQADLLAERQAGMQNQQEMAETLRKEHVYEGCRAIAQQLADKSDVRLQYLQSWANDFQASLDNEARQIVDRGQAHAKNQDYDAAIADFCVATRMDPAIELNTECARAYYDRGLAYHKKGYHDQAIADYTEAIRINPQYGDAYNNRGFDYREKGEYDQAIADYTQAIRINPDFAYAYNNRGFAYREKGEYDQAIADYTEAIRINPQYGNAYNNRGITYREKGEYDQAIADYTEAIRINPDFAYAYNNRGFAYRKKGEYDQAIADYTQALRINPQYGNAYNNRGITYREKGEYDQAIADYTEAIRINPQYGNAYNNRGFAYRKKGEYDQAIADYNEAIRIDPEDANAYYNRGHAYYNKGEYDQAIADYNEAIRIDPEYTLAYCNRGLAYRNKGEYDQEIADYNEAIRIDPKYGNAYNNRGIAYSEKGEYDQAIADYTEAIRINPDDAHAYHNRGRAYMFKVELSKSKADFSKAKELKSEGE